MNHLAIIGNLVRDPELRTIPSGKSVCTFTVAVRKRFTNGNSADADFFRVSAWGAVGENCMKYLKKGSKVAVSGSVTANAYMAKDGTARASLEVSTVDVEFLSSNRNNDSDYSSMPQDGMEDLSVADSDDGFTELPISGDVQIPF